jgi:hypothetical protein
MQLLSFLEFFMVRRKKVGQRYLPPRWQLSCLPPLPRQQQQRKQQVGAGWWLVKATGLDGHKELMTMTWL